MNNVSAYTMNLKGTNYETGYQMGRIMGEIPQLKALHTQSVEGFGTDDFKEAQKLFDQWCPGLTEEIQGFADALQVNADQIFFYGMTYLLPRCSHMALLPSITAEHKPLLARNYEFHHEAEDFCLVKTKIKGKFAHIGTSVLFFGRDDGINEHGLAVTMSSCGFPVGAMAYMREPRIKGLQFWAVIRALLENCKDVSDGLQYIRNMPIAYNLNLILLDQAGNTALVETVDGRLAFKKLDADSSQQFLHATNHPVLPELVPYEPKAFVHSAKRYDYITRKLTGASEITRDQLKNMLLSKYPEGLCTHYYEEYFGTTKSMILSPADRSIDICWGGREENGWERFLVSDDMKETVREIGLNFEKADPVIYTYQPLD
ncbi:linear amide C-N hydrolase [Lacrimispora amygdalina]|uniref:Linear amide C-N hydrolase n=1 Tax=Lacrimispora amygdalina TaxID=253257 RepID=A0A3E2N7W8_9FIRM|nr:C45 family peptidase [Clostridium indicum]RFZ77052.1 linear amide C-N hydrolase [Clostridium indicum]